MLPATRAETRDEHYLPVTRESEDDRRRVWRYCARAIRIDGPSHEGRVRSEAQLNGNSANMDPVGFGDPAPGTTVNPGT